MGCIIEILKIKGDREILPIATQLGRAIVVEGGGFYKGYDYLITFDSLCFRCGYVALPPNHPTNNFYKEKYNNYPDYDVYGGVTFFGDSHIAKAILGDNHCTDKWIGFDCDHLDDEKDFTTAKKYFACDEGILHAIKTLEQMHEFVRAPMIDDRLAKSLPLLGDKFEPFVFKRSAEFVANECKNLIDQLITAENQSQPMNGMDML